jgi:hypothetical protein
MSPLSANVCPCRAMTRLGLGSHHDDGYSLTAVRSNPPAPVAALGNQRWWALGALALAMLVYESSGDWAYTVGRPGKSEVGWRIYGGRAGDFGCCGVLAASRSSWQRWGEVKLPLLSIRRSSA